MFEKIKEYYWKLVGGLPPGEVARQCYREFQKEYEKMVDDKRFDVFTELLHTGIGITDYGKELTGQDVVDLMNEQIDDKAKLECQLRKRTRQRNQLADLNVKLMEENKMLKEENEQLKDKYNEQSVEYEGLEEQVERLLDFKDNVFNIITKKIKNGEQAIEWGESIGANVGAMGFHIEMLKLLLKELKSK